MEFFECKYLYLTDTFIGAVELAADLLKGEDGITVKSESQLENHFFPLRKPVEQFEQLVDILDFEQGLVRRGIFAVGNKLLKL